MKRRARGDGRQRAWGSAACDGGGNGGGRCTSGGRAGSSGVGLATCSTRGSRHRTYRGSNPHPIGGPGRRRARRDWQRMQQSWHARHCSLDLAPPPVQSCGQVRGGGFELERGGQHGESQGLDQLIAQAVTVSDSIEPRGAYFGRRGAMQWVTAVISYTWTGKKEAGYFFPEKLMRGSDMGQTLDVFSGAATSATDRHQRTVTSSPGCCMRPLPHAALSAAWFVDAPPHGLLALRRMVCWRIHDVRSE